jgi:hypothetical protein
LWTIAVAIGALVIVALLILIAVGVLVLPGTAPPAPVNVSSVQFTLLQGTNASGYPWFGPYTFTYTGLANGYPFSAPPGGTFTIPVILENYDNATHTIYDVTVGGPFTLKGTSPALPLTSPALDDNIILNLTVVAPSNPGATLTMFVTINLLPPS